MTTAKILLASTNLHNYKIKVVELYYCFINAQVFNNHGNHTVTVTKGRRNTMEDNYNELDVPRTHTPRNAA